MSHNRWSFSVFFIVACLQILTDVEHATAQVRAKDVAFRVIVVDSCLISSDSIDSAKSSFHNVMLPKSNFSGRLECYVAELATNKNGEQTVTTLRSRVLVLEGEAKRLRVLHKWVKRHGSETGLRGLQGAYEMLQEFCNDHNELHLMIDSSEQNEMQMNLDVFFSAAPRIFNSPKQVLGDNKDLRLIEVAMQSEIMSGLRLKAR